jgi:hypothetical protein
MSGKTLFGLIEIAAAVFIVYLLLTRPSWLLRLLQPPGKTAEAAKEHDFRDIGIGTPEQRDASVKRAKVLGVVFVVILATTLAALWLRGAFQ